MTDETVAMVLPGAGTYRIDPDESTVRYSGKHMFGTGTVHATFGVTGGELRLADPVNASRVRVRVDAGSFSSGSARRDKDVRGPGLLDVEHHPEISFDSDRWRADGDVWVVSGTVTAHGHRVPVDVVVDRVTLDGTRVRVHGRAEQLDRTAFGVTGSRGLVGRHLDLELDASFTTP